MLEINHVSKSFGGLRALNEITFKIDEKQILDLKLSDYTVAEEPGPGADYQTVLIFVMKKEKAAFKLYTDLAGMTTDPAIQELLLSLAQEEAKHKLRFEIEYDDNILSEN